MTQSTTNNPLNMDGNFPPIAALSDSAQAAYGERYQAFVNALNAMEDSTRKKLEAVPDAYQPKHHAAEYGKIADDTASTLAGIVDDLLVYVRQRTNDASAEVDRLARQDRSGGSSEQQKHALLSWLKYHNTAVISDLLLSYCAVKNDDMLTALHWAPQPLQALLVDPETLRQARLTLAEAQSPTRFAALRASVEFLGMVKANARVMTERLGYGIPQRWTSLPDNGDHAITELISELHQRVAVLPPADQPKPEAVLISHGLRKTSKLQEVG